MKKNIPYIIIGVLVVIIILMWQRSVDCSSCVVDNDTIVVYKPVHDTVWTVVETPLPFPIKVIDSVFMVVDTAQIIADLMGVYHYSDTIADSMLIAIIEDQVFQSKVIDRKFQYSILQEKTVTITKTIDGSRNSLYIGPIIGGGQENFAFGGGLTYVAKGGHAASMSVDVLNRSMQVGYYWRIGR